MQYIKLHAAGILASAALCFQICDDPGYAVAIILLYILIQIAVYAGWLKLTEIRSARRRSRQRSRAAWIRAGGAAWQ